LNAQSIHARDRAAPQGRAGRAPRGDRAASGGGEPLWSEASVGPDDQAYFEGRLAVGAGVGVLRTYGGSIRAVDLATGATRWSYACPGAATTRNPLTIVGDCLLALHHEGGEKSVVALELSTGQERWRTVPLRSETAGTPQGYAPIVPVHGAAGSLEALLVPGTDGLFVLRA